LLLIRGSYYKRAVVQVDLYGYEFLSKNWILNVSYSATALTSTNLKTHGYNILYLRSHSWYELCPEKPVGLIRIIPI